MTTARVSLLASDSGLDWEWKKARNTIVFLGVSIGMIGLSSAAGGVMPREIIWVFAGVVGIFLATRSLSDPEPLLALFIAFIPLSKQIVGSVAPGINATNALILLLLISWVAVTSRRDEPMLRKFPANKAVAVYLFFSIASVVQVAITPEGRDFLVGEQTELKGWFDQFIFYFVAVNLVQDGKMARRIVVYMMLGVILPDLLGMLEFLDKRDARSIESSRIDGPQIQPNDFAIFLIYGLGPFVGLLLSNAWNYRVLPLLLHIAIAAQLLVATFSRGGWLGAVAGGVVALYYRGVRFILAFAILGAVIVIAFPSVIPETIALRLGHTNTESAYMERTDRSVSERIVIWDAAIDMTKEDPIFGKGFLQFQELKDHYVAVPVRIGDPHNMYLFIASQMGVPALLAFLYIFWVGFRMSVRVYRHCEDNFGRAIGLGGIFTIVGGLAANMFGTRVFQLETCAYIWLTVIVMSHLCAEIDAREAGRTRKPTYDLDKLRRPKARPAGDLPWWALDVGPGGRTQT